MDLAKHFIKNIINMSGQQGEQWLKNLPYLVDQLSREWQFKLLNPLSNLSFNFVGLVENHQKKKFILKVAPAVGRLKNEIIWLQSFQEITPYIYDHTITYDAYLMDYIDPGTTLKEWIKEKDDEGIQIICEIILKLRQKHRGTPLEFKHLSELMNDLDYLEPHFDKGFLSKIKSLYCELSQKNTEDTLLHGDLHHDNILRANNEWKVIDPHGYLGDPAAEIGPLMYNPINIFPINQPLKPFIINRLKILCEYLPYDCKKLQAWAYCWAALSAAWEISDSGNLQPYKKELIYILEEIVK